MIKLVEIVKRLGSKNILRASLAILAVVSLLIGYGMLNSYTVIDGNNKYTVVSGSKDIDNVLLSAGIKIGDEDTVELGSDGTITVDRTYSQIITPETKLTAAEVTDNVISYTDNMLSCSTIDNVPLFSQGDGSTNLKPLKIEYNYKTVTQSVKFSYKKVYSNKLERGKTTVTKGQYGEKSIVYKQLVIDGVVVSSVKQSEEVTKEPLAQVETIGTKYDYSSAGAVQTNEDVPCISVLKPSKPIELDENGIPINYTNIITGKGSAYSDGNQTSTGVTPRPGYVAVNPKQIPYGTKMYIVSVDGKYIYGYAIAADTGGFAYNGSGRIVDLRFNTESECDRFGVRLVNIYILPD